MNIYDIWFWTKVTIIALVVGSIAGIVAGFVFKLIALLFGLEICWKIVITIVCLFVIAVIDCHRGY